MSIRPIIDWVKNNKIAAVVILFLLFLLIGRTGDMGVWTTLYREEEELTPGSKITAEAVPEADTTAAKDRLVVKESNLSLVVKDVSGTADEIVSYAEREGGFMVSSSIIQPEESATATVVVRVPSEKLKAVVAYFRSLALKVSSENLLGRDVTETYADYEARIKTLETTIVQFEAIKGKATKIADLLNITQKIITLQEQIDTYGGLKKSLAERAAYAKITVYLATDEFALPYQPPAGFRPRVVFKYAVRSLLTNLFAVGGALIWVGVYAVIWGPILIILLIRRWRKRKKSS